MRDLYYSTLYSTIIQQKLLNPHDRQILIARSGKSSSYPSLRASNNNEAFAQIPHNADNTEFFCLSIYAVIKRCRAVVHSFGQVQVQVVGLVAILR